MRDAAMLIPGLPAIVEQLKPRKPGQMRTEDPSEVAAALQFKSLCDGGEPGYSEKVRADYARWRTAQTAVIAQVESSADYSRQQAAAKADFENRRAQATAEEARQLAESLHQICDVSLAEHFRSGAPLVEQAPDPHAREMVRSLVQTGTPTVKAVTQVRKAPAPIAGSAAPTP